jgi:hypothetical protein
MQVDSTDERVNQRPCGNPSRCMDQLPRTRFHTWLVLSLGTAWTLDGLEIALADSASAPGERVMTNHTAVRERSPV